LNASHAGSLSSTIAAAVITPRIKVVVIILFALSLSVAHNLIDGQAFSHLMIAEVGLELIASFILGLILALPVMLILRAQRRSWLRPMSLIISSCLVFFLADQLHHLHLSAWGVSLHIEPLLACLTLGVWVNNWSDQREELEFELHRLSPLVYLTFFTITGASLNLELLTQVWQAAILLFVIRLVGIGLGAAVGGMLAGEPRDQHRYRWMGFVTQAGVGLGLAQRVSSDFPGWGESFAALMIAVIVINEMVGPLFFKSAITKSGEAHANEDMTLETQETEEAQVAQTLKSESSATREVNPTQEIQPKRESSLV
jgi:Kef-type K+ transport system membrane component KefB